MNVRDMLLAAAIAIKNYKDAKAAEIAEAVNAWMDENLSANDDVVIDASLLTEGAAADAKAAGDAITTAMNGISSLGDNIEALDARKPEKDGYYENMSVGNAEQLVATVGVEDKVPYNFRTAGGSADIGDRLVEKIIGGTVAWNQLVQNGNFASSSGWTPYDSNKASLAVENNVATVTISQEANKYQAGINREVGKQIGGHIYLIHADFYPSVSGKYGFDANGTSNGKMSANDLTANTWNSVEIIFSAASNNNTNFLAEPYGTLNQGDTYKVKNINMFDLTQMFGATIADYIYGLETANAGAGVAWFRKLFPRNYYAYDAGSLQSVQAASHITRGFNAWDEEWEVGAYNTTTGSKQNDSTTIRSKNYIHVVPNMTYYLMFPYSSVLAGYAVALFYDENKNFLKKENITSNGATYTIPSNCDYITFFVSSLYGTTYKNDICINLHWDGERDGEYEAYNLHSYPLDSDLVLRGIPKLDANNKLYYDGDEYAADGTVTRRYGIVDLGTLTWMNPTTNVFRSDDLKGIMNATSTHPYANLKCSMYITNNIMQWSSTDKIISTHASYVFGNLLVKDTAYSDATTFKSAMSGVYLVYELLTPTTESADPFQSPQAVDDWGTEEYVDAGVTASPPTRDVAIPVGHESTYRANLRAKLEMAPNSPDGNGKYIVQQTNGVNEYVLLEDELPDAPATDGTYRLKVTVSDGTATLGWEEVTE